MAGADKLAEQANAAAGAAGVGAVYHGVLPGGFAADLDESVPREFGVRFTSEYEPGGDYPPVPPPPAEVQHQMGLHQDAEA
jgi:hypothetical protein